jgi:membrane complex biogenesis BtpA family protein
MPTAPNDPRPIPGLPPGALIGMVHAAALPGSPASNEPVERIAAAAAAEARILVDAGFDAVLVENMHDRPYLRRSVGPETVAAMSVVVAAVRSAIDRPVGVQILAGANRAALAVAHATGATFIRAEGFAFAAVADEGLLDEADAGALLRFRRDLGAGSIAILADIRKKHSSHAITGDIDLATHAEAASFCGADAVVVTGRVTGDATALDDLRAARAGGPLPVVVGSGADAASGAALLALADALIVGSSIKIDGQWPRPVDPVRAAAFVRAARG